MMADSESTPEKFYIFVNMFNPICWHNIKNTGAIWSSGWGYAEVDCDFRAKYIEGTATYLPFGLGNPDCKTASPFCMTATRGYTIEYNAECARLKYAPRAPSRLSAVFAFGDYNACQHVAKMHRWPLEQVRVFRLHAAPLTRIHRANMEIVSLAHTANRTATFGSAEIDAMWRHYWTGGGAMMCEVPVIENDQWVRKTLKSGLTWEYLIEGRLQLTEEQAGAQ